MSIEKQNYKMDTDKQVFFYEQEFYVLSNFSAFAIEWQYHLYPTSEHLYHCMKFGGEKEGYLKSRGISLPAETIEKRHLIQQQIRAARSAHRAFELGQLNKQYRRLDWDEVKFVAMKNILREKVLQHSYVMKKLLETGNRELIEDSWRDDVWGWGPNKDGQNMLGKIWMELRDELIKNIKPKGENNVN